MLTFLATGVVLGLAAGLSPGPLMALVLAQAVRHGVGEGVKAALAPLVTDVPIIIICLLVSDAAAGSPVPAGLISVAGAFYVMFLAAETFRSAAAGLRAGSGSAAPDSLRKGALVNALSPHPYIFWLTIGGPTVVRASSTGVGAAICFLAGFYGCLVGGKVVIAVIAGRSASSLTGAAYGSIMRVLGALLAFFGLMLARDGCQLLGFLPL